MSEQDAFARAGNPLKRRLTDFNSPSGGIAFLEDANINQQGYRLKSMYEKLDPGLHPPPHSDLQTGPFPKKRLQWLIERNIT